MNVIHRALRLTCPLFVFAVVLPDAVAAQQTRTTLLDRAREEFDASEQRALLVTAVAETAGPVDSLWTVVVHELAAAALREGQADLAATWLRLAARHGAQWPIDPNWFEPTVVALYAQVAPSVTTGQELAVERVQSTRWRFSEGLEPGQPGALEVRSQVVGEPPSVTLAGVSSPGRANTVSAPSGSYEVMVTAPGFDTVQFTREILPGTTTFLEVELLPVLDSSVEAAVLNSLVRLTVSANPATCHTGFVVGADGWVVTAYEPLRGSDTVGVTQIGNTPVSLAAAISVFDAATNVAVLKIPRDGLVALPTSAESVRGQFAWVPQFVDCRAPAALLADLPGLTEGSGPLLFNSPMPASTLGAPIVGRSGALIGMVVDEVVGLRAIEISDLVERARRPVAVEQMVTPGGGGSWKWVVGGLAAAGGVVFALTNGGGGSDGPPGTITITVP